MKPSKNIRICDECKEYVAKEKCQICNKDLCADSGCTDNIIFRFDIEGEYEETSEMCSLITLMSCKNCSASMKSNEDDIYKIIKDSRQYKAFYNLIKKTTLRIIAINPAKPDKDKHKLKQYNKLKNNSIFNPIQDIDGITGRRSLYKWKK